MIMVGGSWMLFCGYEALGFSKDPESCFASDFSDKRVTDFNDKRTEDYVDVGERFSNIFQICYYASAIMVVMGLLLCVTASGNRALSKENLQTNPKQVSFVLMSIVSAVG